MSLLYPKIPSNGWLPMVSIDFFGAAIAGLYGVVHDEVTYSISPEYFTELKFAQFHWANFGWPTRAFVAEIGFLATWWVGFLTGWLLARVMVCVVPLRRMLSLSLRGFGITIGFGFGTGALAYLAGLSRNPQPDNSSIADFAASIGVVDVPAFVRVAYIHNAGYLGGLLGLIVALMMLRRRVRLT